MNFDLFYHWVIYDPLRSEKTVIAVDRIKTVLSYSHIDISFQEISEKSVEPVLMVVKGLMSACFIIFHVCYGLTMAMFFCFYGIFIVCYDLLDKKNIKALTNGIYTPFKHEINISFFSCLQSLTVARYIYCFKLVHTLLRHFRQKKYQPSNKL